MKIRIYVTALLVAGLILSGCGSRTSELPGHTHSESCDHDHSSHNHDHDHDHAGHSHEAHSHGADCDHDHDTPAPPDDHDDAIVLNDKQARELDLTYERVTPGAFASVIRTGGVIEGAPGDQATVVATTSGVVGFGGRKLSPGAQVSRGAILLDLASSALAEGNYPQQLADARAELAKAQADLERMESLIESRIVTRADLDAARLAAETAERRVRVLSQNATGSGRSISAPIGGYLTSLYVSEGDYVEAGQPLAVISANRSLVLRADVPQRYLTQLPAIRSARFTTPYDGHSYDLSQLGGRLIGPAQSVAAGSATLPLRFEFSNSAALLPGSVVEVFLQGHIREGVMTVPLSALTEEQGAYYLYLRTAPEHYLKRAVRTGESDGDRVEILSGLAAGEEVVTRGAYYVRLASMSGEIPHGHSH